MLLLTILILSIILTIPIEIRRGKLIDEKIERENMILAEWEYQKKKEEEAEKQAKRAELTKKLNSVRNELALLDKLDNVYQDNLKDERSIKKRLTLEKQYARAWEKERKLVTALKELDEQE